MARRFNTAGMCRPKNHYMLPPEARLTGLRSLIDDQGWFVIHAPRQTGKTTTTHLLAEALAAEGKYAAVLSSCKAGSVARNDIERGVRAVIYALDQECRRQLPPALCPEPPDAFDHLAAEVRFGEYLSRWCERCPLPVVLFLDEFDALADDTLLSILDQLHASYPNRPKYSPHALGLIGLRDVRDYKIARRDGANRIGSSSPFNIKSDSLTLRNFTAEEVAQLYEQHSLETGQQFSSETKAQAFHLTGGQPWLVNMLARLLVEQLVPNREKTIEVAHLEIAKEALIRRRDTHLDSLVDRLRNLRVRKVIEPLLTGTPPADDVFDDDLQFTKDLGLVTSSSEGLKIANPIYREIIPRALTASTEDFLPVQRSTLIGRDGRLQWDQMLDGFTEFWKNNAEWMISRQLYPEAAAQLVFMAWLHRVVNGGAEIEARPAGVAAIDREYAVGSGRIDLLVRWPLASGEVEHFAAELKVRRDGGSAPLGPGLEQLSEYLERLGLDTGTLILFDQRSNAPPIHKRCSREILEHGGRQIIVLRL